MINGYKMVWTTYCLDTPIDYFYNASKISDVVQHFIDNPLDAIFDHKTFAFEELRDFLKSYAGALDEAEKAGYDKYRPRQEPMVIWLPNITSLSPAFIFKSDNNGQTYVVSSEDLPYLENHIID